MRHLGIKHYRILVLANKVKVRTSPKVVEEILKIVLDRRSHPVMVHCNKGKVGFSMPSCFDCC